jgi:hypothetical protein
VGARAIALASFLLIGEGMVLIGAPLIGAHMSPFLFGSEAHQIVTRDHPDEDGMGAEEVVEAGVGEWGACSALR